MTTDWSMLSNKKVADAFKRFVRAESSARELSKEFKNCEVNGEDCSTVFNRLVRKDGVDKLRQRARSALKRRKLI